jgi:murein DD-endopeptidase MepM/ murein hydrolase activator NlpD
MQSGTGVVDGHIWIPGMRFPLQAAKAFANSQVYGHGGMSGPGGGQCDAANYSYPWHDNFCEVRGYTTVLCPTGKGHQGQDIRPNACKAATYTAVAAETGTITQISSYIVYLTADSGRRYDYLHMQMNQLKVHVGDHVTRGQPLGLVSNNFGSTPTTIHLHLEIKQPVTQGGTSVVTFIPLYSSLVDAYQRMLAGTP